MDTRGEEVAPAVRSILEAAHGRSGGQERISVDARSLPDALETAGSEGHVPVIAEIKPTSPTTTGTRNENPVDLAEAMVDGGAAALSVLTEPDHFDGSAADLRRVRQAVDVPVLRKDFVVREAQLDRARADLVLLIARFLADDLDQLVPAARARGMEPLVEVHNVEELNRALAADARIIGINNRDLAALEVDLSTFERVAPHVPEEITLLAESGIGSRADVRRMMSAGADGLLIGSAIMDAEGGGDVETNTRRFTTTDIEVDS